MNRSTPQGFALVLILVGVVVAVAGSVVTVVTGDRRWMGVAAAGFAVQFAGWKLHGRRMGGV